MRQRRPELHPTRYGAGTRSSSTTTSVEWAAAIRYAQRRAGRPVLEGAPLLTNSTAKAIQREIRLRSLSAGVATLLFSLLAWYYWYRESPFIALTGNESNPCLVLGTTILGVVLPSGVLLERALTRRLRRDNDGYRGEVEAHWFASRGSS